MAGAILHRMLSDNALATFAPTRLAFEFAKCYFVITHHRTPMRLLVRTGQRLQAFLGPFHLVR